MFGYSALDKNVEVKTSRQHYIGYVVGRLKSNKYDVKITEVINGNKKVGQVGRFDMSICHSI